MRISDWSSDVCSSDLREGADRGERGHHRQGAAELQAVEGIAASVLAGHTGGEEEQRLEAGMGDEMQDGDAGIAGADGDEHEAEVRSEEHTSELQSLMRISYAVFCLKKKTTRANNHVHKD